MNKTLTRKEETRRRIVDTAARLFLEKGVDGVGLDEIMREAGLTHGGFYVHFPSKEALISEACVQALGETTQQWETLARRFGEDAQWEAFLQANLAGDMTSGANPACPAALLGADIARRQDTVQTAYIAKLKALIDVIATESGAGPAHAILTFSALVGATALAAQVGQDKALAAKILNTTRDELLKCRPAGRQDRGSEGV